MPISPASNGLPGGLKFFHKAAVTLRADPPRAPNAPLTTLDRQHAVELWHHERGALGDL